MIQKNFHSSHKATTMSARLFMRGFRFRLISLFFSRLWPKSRKRVGLRPNPKRLHRTSTRENTSGTQGMKQLFSYNKRYTFVTFLYRSTALKTAKAWPNYKGLTTPTMTLRLRPVLSGRLEATKSNNVN